MKTLRKTFTGLVWSGLVWSCLGIWLQEMSSTSAADVEGGWVDEDDCGWFSMMSDGQMSITGYSCTNGRSIECQRSVGLVTTEGHWEGGGCQRRTGGSLDDELGALRIKSGIAVNQLGLAAVVASVGTDIGPLRSGNRATPPLFWLLFYVGWLLIGLTNCPWSRKAVSECAWLQLGQAILQGVHQEIWVWTGCRRRGSRS